MQSDSLNFVQISDSHLYADKKALHYGAPVYSNLVEIFKQIRVMDEVEFIVFTGDLTQDHSSESYQNFVDAVHSSNCDKPIYYLSGNHDDTQLMSEYFDGKPFLPSKVINHRFWQIQLVSTKSETPAGVVSANECQRVLTSCDKSKHQLLMMHHHPVPVGYFIDRHGLTNHQQFVAMANDITSLKGVCCGHVHNALDIPLKLDDRHVTLFTCPATSIQFDKYAQVVENANIPGGFRTYSLTRRGDIHSTVHFL